ncbi:MAG: aryl-sulfate sulfotransferase [Chitinophagales bacterium]|nr:aryl-sulfate sulfotransferase [Chitinophagales bacterium]
MNKCVLFALLFNIALPGYAQFRYISPQPGSIYQHPERNIILRDGREIDEVSIQQPALFKISGSRSGYHEVNCRLSDDGKTILIQPVTPFSFNEEITVDISNGIRTQAGEELQGFVFRFHTCPAPTAEATLEFEKYRKKMMEELSGSSSEDGLTDPSLQSPPLEINVNTNPAPGEVFFHSISLTGAPVEQAAIMSSDGHFLMRTESQVKGLNFDINRNGYLTLYDETTASYQLLDSNYNVINSFQAGNGYITDIHEFVILPDGHSFIIGLDYQTVDMTVYNPNYSPHATVIGAVLQELDASKNVIFEWRSWDYVDIPEALHESLFFSFIDYVHANSIDIDTDGNILLSCRHLDQVIKIDRNTGDMIWRLGGVMNQFTFLNDTLGFNYQHDARRIANGNITLYDNGNYHPVKTSFAKEYRLDEVNMTASKVWSYTHPFINGKTVRGFAMGNMQRLPNGNTFINWGSIYIGSVLGKGSPNLTEVDSLGNIVWEMTLDQSTKGVIYRAHRYVWEPCARPTENTLKSKNITESSAKLTWGHATNATGYTIFYKSLTDSVWSSKSASGTSKVLNDLLPGTVYQWYIQTKCDTIPTVTSATSKWKKFTTLPQKNAAVIADESDIHVYPNPANSYLTIDGLNGIDNHITLFDVWGRMVLASCSVAGETCTFNINNLLPGIYFLKIVQDEKQLIKTVEILKQ